MFTVPSNLATSRAPHLPVSAFPFRRGAGLSDSFVNCAHRAGRETTAQANDSERRVANVSREIDSQAPEIAAGRQRSRDLRAPPTSRGEAISPGVSRVRGAVVSGLPTRSIVTSSCWQA
jgi:hypothetical protein